MTTSEPAFQLLAALPNRERQRIDARMDLVIVALFVVVHTAIAGYLRYRHSIRAHRTE